MAVKNFDVPTALRFADGNIAGIQAFRAMLNDSSENSLDRAAGILKVISEAVVAVNDLSADTARQSAAVKLLELVAKALQLGARNSSHMAWLDGKQREAERCRQVVLRLEHRRIRQQAIEDARFQSFIASFTEDYKTANWRRKVDGAIPVRFLKNRQK